VYEQNVVIIHDFTFFFIKLFFFRMSTRFLSFHVFIVLGVSTIGISPRNSTLKKFRPIRSYPIIIISARIQNIEDIDTENFWVLILINDKPEYSVFFGFLAAREENEVIP
jgi:hypothetical protein